MGGITQRQFRISRHVTLEALHAELLRRHQVTGSLDSLSKWEQTQGHQRPWCGLNSQTVRNAIIGLHQRMADAGQLPPADEVRRQDLRLIPDADEVKEYAAEALEVIMNGGQEPPPRAPVRRREFTPLWNDPTLTLNDVSRLFDLSEDDAVRCARDFGLTVPKPYGTVAPAPAPLGITVDGLVAEREAREQLIRAAKQHRAQAVETIARTQASIESINREIAEAEAYLVRIDKAVAALRDLVA